MALISVERIFGRKEVVTERPETLEFPTALTKEAGIEKVETSFPATAKDAQGPQGQPLIQTPQTQPLTITIPVPNREVLEQDLKTSKDETRFGNAFFWIRAIQKAIHFGKRIIFGTPKVSQPV